MLISKIHEFISVKIPLTLRNLNYGVLVLLISVALYACDNKEKKAGQALARVNGVEITVLQINDELRREGVKADQQEAATKQLLEKLIDRQLIINEAIRNKIDRSPDVIHSIERAKAQIIAQAYLESIVKQIAKPSKAEIDEYFQNHPVFFSQRKQFDIQQLVIDSKDNNNELKSALDSAESLDEVAVWLEGHNIKYVRGQLSRSTTELPEQMVAKLNEMKKGELFIVNEVDKTMLNFISDIRIIPVSAKDAAPLIEQYLSNKKAKEATDAEIANLRSSSKIEYLNVPASSAQ